MILLSTCNTLFIILFYKKMDLYIINVPLSFSISYQFVSGAWKTSHKQKDALPLQMYLRPYKMKTKSATENWEQIVEIWGKTAYQICVKVDVNYIPSVAGVFLYIFNSPSNLSYSSKQKVVNGQKNVYSWFFITRGWYLGVKICCKRLCGEGMLLVTVHEILSTQYPLNIYRCPERKPLTVLLKQVPCFNSLPYLSFILLRTKIGLFVNITVKQMWWNGQNDARCSQGGFIIHDGDHMKHQKVGTFCKIGRAHV